MNKYVIKNDEAPTHVSLTGGKWHVNYDDIDDFF